MTEPARPAPDQVRTAVAPAFRLEGRAVRARAMGGGLINDSFRVTTCAAGGRTGDYVLQAINTRVFPDPASLMENMGRVCEHLEEAVCRRGEERRRALVLVPTLEGGRAWVDEDGRWWRALVFAPRSRTFERATSGWVARNAAAAFGRFLRDLDDLPGPSLHSIIPGFHDTPARLAALRAAAESDPLARAGGAAREIEALLARADRAEALEGPRRSGDIVLRPVHNDTKIDNVLFDRDSRSALCVVDLDTVMPGLALHDFGDLVRSAGAADAGAPDRTILDMERYEAVLRGWAGEAGTLLGPVERDLLAIAPQVLALELAARFLTDHLLGDVYFKTPAPGLNLQRCRSQLSLLESMQAQEPAMRRLARETVGQ